MPEALASSETLPAANKRLRSPSRTSELTTKRYRTHIPATETDSTSGSSASQIASSIYMAAHISQLTSTPNNSQQCLSWPFNIKQSTKAMAEPQASPWRRGGDRRSVAEDARSDFVPKGPKGDHH